MQSSSRLFPVALVSAELRADLTEDIYRLKPGNSPDASVELVVTRLGQQAAGERRGPPVILPAREFFQPPLLVLAACARIRSLPGAGGVRCLAAGNARPWPVDSQRWLPGQPGRRLRALRPAGAGLLHPRAVRAAGALDWPLPRWGGAGGGAGRGYLDQARIASVALFGSQVSTAHWLFRLPMAGILARLLLRRVDALSGSRWRQGPEDEPVGVALEVLRWHGLFGRFGEPGNDWWKGSPQSTCRYWRSPGLGTGRTRPGPVASCSSSSPRPSANTCCSDARLATPRTTGISRC